MSVSVVESTSVVLGQVWSVWSRNVRLQSMPKFDPSAGPEKKLIEGFLPLPEPSEDGDGEIVITRRGGFNPALGNVVMVQRVTDAIREEVRKDFLARMAEISELIGGKDSEKSLSAIAERKALVFLYGEDGENIQFITVTGNRRCNAAAFALAAILKSPEKYGTGLTSDKILANLDRYFNDSITVNVVTGSPAEIVAAQFDENLRTDVGRKRMSNEDGLVVAVRLDEKGQLSPQICRDVLATSSSLGLKIWAFAQIHREYPQLNLINRLCHMAKSDSRSLNFESFDFQAMNRLAARLNATAARKFNGKAKESNQINLDTELIENDPELMESLLLEIHAKKSSGGSKRASKEEEKATEESQNQWLRATKRFLVDGDKTEMNKLQNKSPAVTAFTHLLTGLPDEMVDLMATWTKSWSTTSQIERADMIRHIASITPGSIKVATPEMPKKGKK